VNYLTRDLPGRNYGVLTGGTYFYEIGRGVNQANIWGDFYYLEALMRWGECGKYLLMIRSIWYNYIARKSSS